MIKRLKIKDYMAHKETELELGPGVTVLTGPNNSGKSALVEALRSLAQNPAPQHVIRHGASKAVVRVEVDSGEAIEWVRSKGSSVYQLFKADHDGGGSNDDPEVYAKFGRMPPEDIRNLLRLDLVETESGSVDIHIGNQRYPIFLLDQTGSQAASFFAASTEAEYLLQIQQALKTKTDRARNKRKELVQERVALERNIELYLPLEDIEPVLSKAEWLYGSLVGLQKTIPILDQSIELLQETGFRHDGKMAASAVLERLSPLPQIHETKGLEVTLEDLQRALSRFGAIVANSASLEPLLRPPEVQETFRLDSLIQTCKDTQTSLNGTHRRGDALAILDPPPVLRDIKDIDEMIRNLQHTEKAHLGSIATREALHPITSPPDLNTVGPLQTFIQQLTASMESFNQTSLGKSALEGLTEPPELHDLKPLEECAASLEESRKRLNHIQSLNSILVELTQCDEPQHVAEGDKLLGIMEELRGHLDANALLQEQLVSGIAQKRQEISRVIQEFGLCPLCGHTLDMDHFLEATHG